MGTDLHSIQVCRSCGATGAGNYCSQCGRPYAIKPVTLTGLLTDAVRDFTNLDQGFGYTLKRLLLAPGQMQWAYLHEEQSRYKKPFAMFFICATIAAVGRHLIFGALDGPAISGLSEAQFFQDYWVVLQVMLLPVHVLVVYLLFRKSGHTFADIAVLLLYTFSFFFLTVCLLALTKFVVRHIDTAWIELPILTAYMVITNLNFFRTLPPWSTIVKSVLLMIVIFQFIQLAEDLALQWLQ